MSAAIAVHPPSHSSPLRPRDNDNHNISSSPHPHHSMAATRSSQNDLRRSVSSSSSSGARAVRNNASQSPSQETGSGRSQPQKNGTSNPTSSPSSFPVIKKERPSSSEGQRPPPLPPLSAPSVPVATSRHRPRKLDLSRGKPTAPGASTSTRPSAPLTSKDSGNLSALHDVGIACLSPGFQTHDPSMQQQLARSMEMRDQQRQIIEARLHGKTTSGLDKTMTDAGPQTSALAKAPSTSKRKGPPPGLSITAPSAQQFAHEPRVIQSAPLHRTFTGLKPPSNLSRQILDPQREGGPQPPVNPPSSHGPAPQTSNRLPPISDVIASESLGSARREEAAHRKPAGLHAPSTAFSPAQPSGHGPLPSPGYPHPPASAGFHARPRTITHDALATSRPREYRSAEEALQSLSGGRDDLLPKIVHYGGHQPPTPPSPQHSGQQNAAQKPGSSALHPEIAARSGSGRRRTREEYEQDQGEGDKMDVDPRDRDRRPQPIYGMWDEDRGREKSRRYAPVGRERESSDTDRRKKEEFMALCARAWDLLHS